MLPFGALLDSMPQNDMKLVSMANKTIEGVHVGNHVHAGGVWSGDYYVAEYSPLKQDCEVKMHRIGSLRNTLVECQLPRRRTKPGASAQR